MKKVVLFILTLLLVIGLFSCGSNNGNENPVEPPVEENNPNNNGNEENKDNENEENKDNDNEGNQEENLVNPFISTTGLPLLCAHRGGSTSNPENTLKAYKYAVDVCEADILESDVWLTKDNKLVLNHDSSVTRTSDAETYFGRTSNLFVKDLTLDELRQLNFGYTFKDSKGNKPYSNLVSDVTSAEERSRIVKENDVQILTLEELLGYFYAEHKELLFVIEIKNSGTSGFEAAKIINELLIKYPDYSNRLVVSTFNNDVLEHLKENYPKLLMGAATKDAETFVKNALFNTAKPDQYEFDCLQIPVKYALNGQTVDLIDEKLINAAHENNISVQYWTINDKATMEKLIALKCDAIMTDDPYLLRTVLNNAK